MQQFNSERNRIRKFLTNARFVCLSLFALFLSTQAGAQNFIVNNNGDTHAASAATSPLDGSGNITLRSACEAATAQAGPHIITFAGGITSISISLGQIFLGSATSSNITINGPGMATLTVTQTTASRIFTTTTQPNFNFTLQDMTITYAGPATTIGGGGGALLAGGTGAVTTVNRVKCTNWKLQVGNGGAIAVTFASLSHNFNMADCVFDNNKCGGTGGAVTYDGLGTVVISGCTFTNNSTGVVGANTGGSGGALSLSGQAPGGTYSVTKCTFLNNNVENVTSQGGALTHVNGHLTLNYNRFVGNTAATGSVLFQSGGDAANTVDAKNNWWGHNIAPTAAEVAVGPSPVTAPDVTNWLQLKLTASPGTLCATTSPTTSLVTASFLTNSAGTAIPVANLTTLIGLPISYSAVLGTLSGAQTTIQATGTATVTFTSNGTAGAASVNGVVDNVPANDATAKASITVNILPNISSQPINATTCAGSTTTFSVIAGGTPAPTYQWRIGTTNLSNGATGNGSTIAGATTNTLTITNTALADAAANYNVVVTNSCGVVISNNVSLTVKALPVVTAPTITQPTCTTPTGTIVVNATGASGTIEYSINNGGSYQASATFSGLAPSSSNNIVVRYTAAPNCPVAYASNPVVISAIPLPPTVNNPVTTTGTVGTAFSQSFTTTGGLAPMAFATTSTLPTGFTLSAAGVLSGTTTQSGTFPIVVKATDANGCVGTGATYNLVISCQTITVTNPGVATGTNGTAFSQTFTQAGALGGATFTVNTGVLPNGLSLSAAGVLSGTPSATAGSYPITVKVTDGNGCTGISATYNLVISCPTITVTNPVVTTGQLNIPFSQTFTASGGLAPYTYTTGSALPAGITLSSAGVLSGTPTGTGTFPITVNVKDANLCAAASPLYTLVITACPVVNQTVSASPTSICTGTASTITVGASQAGVNYTLRTSPTNTVIAGPTASNGPAINFGTGNLIATTTYNVLAETDKYSVYLDGNQSGFAIPQASPLDVTDNFTIEGWIKPDGDPDFGRLFNKDGCYALGIGGGQSQLTFTRHGAGDFSRPFTFVTGTWYHIAGTYSGGTVELFVNGTSIGTVGGVPAIVTNTVGGHIGSDASGNFNQFRGSIDNVRIWNTVRTQAQIAANQGAFLTSTGNPSLVASWWIIEGSGNAKDYSANAINSTGLVGTWQADAPVAPCSIILPTTPTVTVLQNNTITLTSAAGTDAQTKCINTAITPITYSTTVATGATFSGLPAGVTGNWAANVVTISGSPTTTVGSPFTYTVTLTGGCGTASTTGTITVLPNNTITLTSAAGTNAQTVCNNSPITTITYSTTGATGATVSGLPAGVTGAWAANVVTISGSPTTSVGSPFNYTVTLTGGCGAITATGSITVNPTPATPTITPGGPTTFCAGGSVTLTSSSASGNQWYLNNNPIGGATGQTYVATASGNYTVVVTSLGCPSAASAITTVTVNPIPATPTITPGGPVVFCAGGSVTLTSSSASGNQWYLNGNPIGGATSQTYVATASGNYTVIVTSLGCSSAASAAITVTVNPVPTVNAVGNQAVCNGANTTLVTFSGSPAGTVFNWTNDAPSIGLAASGTGDIASFTGTNATGAPVTATITVTPSYTNAGVTCLGTPITFTITVNPTPTVNTVGNQTICNGAPTTTINFSGAVAGTVYNWTNNTPSIGLAASGSGNIGAFIGTNATNAPITATITVTPSYTNAGATCTGTPTTFTITVNPSNTVAQVGAQTVCNGSPTTAVSFSSTATGGTVVYNWTGTDGTIGLPTSGTGSIASFTATNIGLTAVTDTIKVTASYTNGGTTCTSAVMLFVITVNPTALVNTVADQTVCNGAPTTAVTFSGTGPGTVYTWTNNTTSIGLAASGVGNIASFTGINATGAPVTATVTVTPVFYNQSIQGALLPGDLTMPSRLFRDGIPSTCANKAFPGTSAGAHLYDTYNFTNTTGQAQCVTISYAAKSTGDVFVAAYNGSFNPASLSTNYLADGGLSSIGGSVTTFSVSVAAGATLVVVASEANSAPCPLYVLSVNGIGFNCTGTPKTFNITVNPTATVNAVANQELCNGATTTAVNFSSPTTGGTIVYNWTNNTPSIGLAASGSGNIAPFVAANLTNSPVVASITVTPSYTNGATTCVGTPTTFTITVDPKAQVNPVGNQVVCNGANTTAVVFSGTTASTVYNWTNNTPSIGLAASGTGNIASFVATNATTAPVTATITVTPTFTGGSGSCPGIPITFTITVNPTATVNAVSNQVICNNANTTAVTFSSPTTGGTIVYNWTNNTPSIGLAASGSGNIASFVGTNATGAPVTATITVTPSYTNAAVTCVGTPITFTITVNPTPTVNAVANQVVCNGANTTAVTFTGTAPGTVYNWTNNTTSIGLAASGSGNIASFVATNATTAPVIATITVTPSYTNGGTTCTGTPITFTITVNPTATVNAVANQVVCNGANTTAVTFSSPTTGGTIVYNWTNNTASIGLAATGSGNIASFVATNATTGPVTATITVTPSYTNGAVTCVGTPITFTITVNPTATVNTVTNQVVCNGANTTAVTFSSPTTGGTIVYNWTNNTTSIGLAASGIGNIASFVATNITTAPVIATITVTPSYTNGSVTCVGTPKTFTITVNPTATINAVANQVVCNGANTTAVTFSSPTTGGTIVYNWTNNTTSIGLAATGSGNIASFVATNATTGPVTATITVTPSYTNGAVTCVGTPITFTITVNPTATVNAVANQVVCNNANTTAVTFSSPTTGGTIVYNWTNNTTSIGLAATGSGNIASFVATNVTTGPVTATITVTPSYTNGSVTCVGTPITFTITVNPTATINAVANQVVCNGANTTAVTFSSPTTGGTIVYNWTNNTTSIGLAASGVGNIASFVGTNATTAPATATITVTPSYTNGSVTCVGTPITFTITVNPTATINAVANQVICNGANTTAVTFSSPTTGGTIVYNWTNNTTSIGLAATGSGNIASFVGTNATTAPVTATITVTPSYTNGGVTCVGTLITFTITVNPTATINAVANQVVCNNANTTAVTFSSPTTGGTIVYNWTNNTTSIGLAATGSGNIASFVGTNATIAPVTATITVTPSYTNGGVTCIGTPITFTITVNPTATINAVANQTICNNANTTAINFSSPTTGGTIVYNWINSTPSIGLAATGSGNIASFVGTNATLSPVIATIVATPSYTNGGVTCVGTPITFTITVNPTAPVNTVANQVVCNNANTTAITFSSPATGGTIVYNWTNNTASIGLAATGSGNIASFVATNSGTAPVTATITVTPTYSNGGANCVGTPTTFTITVNPTATVTAVANQTVCNNANTTAVTFSSPTTGGTIVYNWTNNTPAIGLAASGTGNIPSFVGTNTTSGLLIATITVTPTYSNGGATCVGTPTTFTITVNPVATVNTVANQTVCNNANTTAITFSSPTTGGTIVYNWTNNTTSIGLAASGTGNIPSFVGTNATNGPVTATITVTPTYSNGGANCVGTPTTFTITVNPVPVVNSILNQILCNKSITAAVTFSSPNIGGTVTYNWTNTNPLIGLAASGTGNIPSFIANNLGILPLIAIITVTPSYTNGGVTCTGTPKIFTIIVNPTPLILVLNAPPRICLTDTAVVLKASPAGGTWAGTALPGGALSSGVFDPAKSGQGAFTLTYTYIDPAFLCPGTAFANVFVVDCIERHNKFKEALKVYPNPNNGKFFVKLLSDSYKSINLRLVDGRGREVGKFTFSNLFYGSILPFDVRSLASGVYMLEAYSDNEKATFQVVIQH